MSGSVREVLRSSVFRWTVVFGVLVFAMVLAIWPRSSAPQTGAPTASGAAPRPSCRRGPTLPNWPRSGPERPCGVPRHRRCRRAELGAERSDGDLSCRRTPDRHRVATAGRPLVVNIWATWCGPCRRELPVLDAFAARAGDSVTVLAAHDKQGADAYLHWPCWPRSTSMFRRCSTRPARWRGRWRQGLAVDGVRTGRRDRGRCAGAPVESPDDLAADTRKYPGVAV